MKVHKGKYGQIHLIASLTSGLSRYHDEFSVAVVDEVCSVLRELFKIFRSSDNLIISLPIERALVMLISYDFTFLCK